MTTLPALNRAQLREVAKLLDAPYGIAPLARIELAGRNVALLAKRMVEDDLADRPLVILAGRGHKAASALVAARHLLNWSAWVQIVCSHAQESYGGVAGQQLQTLMAMGAPLAWAEEGWELPPCDLVVDGLVGTGLQGEPQGKVRELIHLANSSVAPILSLDLPSGVDADEGAIYTPHIRAAATLAISLPTVGHLHPSARQSCGDLYVGDVGIPLPLYAELGVNVSPIFGRDPIVRWDVVDGMAQVVEE
jgi:NAD(P)H-hydrate epimerase